MYRYLDRTGSVVISPTQTEKYRPYGVFDCRVSLDKPRYSCFVEANNLFNKKYYDYGRIPQPGFWIMAGASFNINL
jgi:putative outer membrane receptor for transport of vitamin B